MKPKRNNREKKRREIVKRIESLIKEKLEKISLDSENIIDKIDRQVELLALSNPFEQSILVKIFKDNEEKEAIEIMNFYKRK
jgi:hypothetical protein